MKKQIDWRTKEVHIPTRSFTAGEMVEYGHHEKTEVLGTDDNGATYNIRNFGMKKVYGVPTEYDETSSVNWFELLKLNSHTKSSFAQDASFRMNQSNRDIYGLLNMVCSEYAGVYFTPEYQREYVWSNEDKVKLIDSIFNNVTIGLFVFALLPYETDGKLYEIIDGKQRLIALVEFFEDRFTYKGLFFSQLSRSDAYHFKNYGISIGELREPTEKEKYAAFLAVNTFGKVMDSSHLDAVREKYEKM